MQVLKLYNVVLVVGILIMCYLISFQKTKKRNMSKFYSLVLLLSEMKMHGSLLNIHNVSISYLLEYYKLERYGERKVYLWSTSED